MTKTSKLADIICKENNDTQESKKRIVFEKVFEGNKIVTATNKPFQWKNIILLEKSYYGQGDLMWAYDDDISWGHIIMGQWNDGVV